MTDGFTSSGKVLLFTDGVADASASVALVSPVFKILPLFSIHFSVEILWCNHPEVFLKKNKKNASCCTGSTRTCVLGKTATCDCVADRGLYSPR